MLLNESHYQKKLLVMSVYGAQSYKWYPIQTKYLSENSFNFEHAIYLNNINIEHKGVVVGRTNTSDKGYIQHLNGLCELIKYAMYGDYRAWLILDCDCFPIVNNWESLLNNRNSAIVRIENFDTFIHPSCVYCVDKSIRFSISDVTNLLGDNFSEIIGVGDGYFPLFRTNMLNYHKVAYGIYYNAFYHHGAGSRRPIFRSDSYYGMKSCAAYTDKFFEDPNMFINNLKQ